MEFKKEIIEVEKLEINECGLLDVIREMQVNKSESLTIHLEKPMYGQITLHLDELDELVSNVDDWKYLLHKKNFDLQYDKHDAYVSIVDYQID